MSSQFKPMLMTHKTMFNEVINYLTNDLTLRSQTHDMDKLVDPRVAEVYEEHFPKLKQIPFGTEEYLAYEKEYFWDAHMLHAQERHHFYSSKNTSVENPNLNDLLEAVIDIYVSNKQYNSNPDIEAIMETFEKKGILNWTIADYIENTLKDLEERE